MTHKGFLAPCDASREFSHQHDLLSTVNHVALVSMLATRQSTDQATHADCTPIDAVDLLITPASDPTTPNHVSDVDKSPQADAWRQAMKDSGGLI